MLFLTLAFEMLFFLLYCLSQLESKSLCLAYCILFNSVWLLSLRELLLCEEGKVERKENGCEGEERGAQTRRGKGNCGQEVLHDRRIHFQSKT